MMKNYNFVGNLKRALIISITIMLIGVAFLIINQGVDMDISFKGGTRIQYEVKGAVDAAKVEKAVEEVLGHEVEMEQSDKMLTFTLVENIDNAKYTELQKRVAKDFPTLDTKNAQMQTLEASMGTKFLLRCALALGLAAALLIVYVGFRFRKIGGVTAGVSALIALLHDLLIVFFTFVVFGIELNDNFVAVMLTILGYSLNDTIVIFDRVRTMRRRSDAPLADVVNDSLHHVMRRTIITTVTTCVAILAVLVVALAMGVTSIISFALPMLLGAISGSYSSLFLSGPIWVKWMERREAKAAKKA